VAGEVPRRITFAVCTALPLNDNFLQELAQIIKSMDLLLQEQARLCYMNG
jgi:hypothetical protein